MGTTEETRAEGQEGLTDCGHKPSPSKQDKQPPGKLSQRERKLSARGWGRHGRKAPKDLCPPKASSSGVPLPTAGCLASAVGLCPEGQATDSYGKTSRACTMHALLVLPCQERGSHGLSESPSLVTPADWLLQSPQGDLPYR